MANADMREFWNTRGGDQWVREGARYDAMLAPCAVRLLDGAQLAEGETVLDVGCGAGATTVEAARRVTPGGHVVGVDLSGPMLARASERAAASSVPAKFLQGDAQTMAFEETFDVVISRFGIMFFDDPDAAFANLARALRPGGRLCVVCWKEMFANEWIAVPAAAAVAHVGMPELPDRAAPGAPEAPGPFSLADPDKTKALLERAGFTDVTLDDASDGLRIGDDVDDVTSFVVSGEMVRRLFEGKDPAVVDQALDAVRSALTPFATDEGVVLGGSYWVVRAAKV
ncbi:MAG: class I SAM-dependent methyltransferase [Acidimicrobiales bacterium]